MKALENTALRRICGKDLTMSVNTSWLKPVSRYYLEVSENYLRNKSHIID